MKWVSMAEQPITSLRSPCAMPSVGWSWCKACHQWPLEQWKSVLWSEYHASPSGSPTDESGFGGCQENATCPNAWPAQSPDLNSIEHLWDEFESRLRRRRNSPTSVPDLTNALMAEWKQVPAAMFKHLMEILPRRVEVVIASKVGPTPY